MKVEQVFLAARPTSKHITDFVADTARVSFSKRGEDYSAEKNVKLVKFLNRSGHWSPFAHVRFFLTSDEWRSVSKETRRKFRERKLYRPSGIAMTADNGVSYSLWDLMEMGMGQLNPEAVTPHTLFSLPSFYTQTDYSFRRGACGARSFRIKASLPVLRQLGKHQGELVWNEVSRRYVATEPEMDLPDYWRAQSPDAKQGSLDTPVRNLFFDLRAKLAIVTAKAAYRYGIKHGVAREQARGLLPQFMGTTVQITGTARAFERIYDQRLKPDAQKEIRDLVQHMKDTDYATMD